jgi:transcriptional regulator with PAS, ATPase and Fis domain
MQLLREEIDYVAGCDAKVLITGPSGAGKELVARLVHSRSPRRQGPLVAINCAAFPDSLLESELFGHVRGSFTGAVRDKNGLLASAQGGTVFMDEVAEMSPRMQALLLRFLETGEIQRVGAERQHTASNVRIIAATNRNLADRVAAGEFREDLFYRLNVIHLTIPALRDRREDIVPLLAHYLAMFFEREQLAMPEIAIDARQLLERYAWPGNVRELRNVAERLCYRAVPLVTAAVLPEEITRSAAPPPAAAPVDRAHVTSILMDRMVRGGESFWDVAHAPFMTRDLTREDVRQLVVSGLSQTRGSYKSLVRTFNMSEADYRRFLNFLRKYECHMPFQRFRPLPPRAAASAAGPTRPAAGR